MAAPVIDWVRPGVGFTPAAASSFRRAEADLGRRIDVNSSYRDYDQQMRMWRNWQAYINGRGPHPGHSRALHPDTSMHCQGLAVDSDDWRSPGFIRFFAERGWIRTAASDPTEQHHFEYQVWNDQHRNRPASTDAKPFEPKEDTLSQAEVDEIKRHISAEAQMTRAHALRLADGVPGAGATLNRYVRSDVTRDIFALYSNGFGMKFRVRVTEPAAVAALEALNVVSVDRAAVIWPYDIVWPDDGDDVATRPGEFVQHAESDVTGNIFELFRDSNGNRVRHWIDDRTEIAKLKGNVPVLEQRELWRWASTNQ